MRGKGIRTQDRGVSHVAWRMRLAGFIDTTDTQQSKGK